MGDAPNKVVKINLKILHKTTPVAPNPFAVHPQVPAQVANRVQSILLALGAIATARRISLNVPIQQFGKAKTPDYEVLENMVFERFYVKNNQDKRQ